MNFSFKTRQRIAYASLLCAMALIGAGMAMASPWLLAAAVVMGLIGPLTGI